MAHSTDDDVELLTPNVRAFGTGADLALIDDDDVGDAAFDDEPRSPWTMVVAGLLVLALILVGVVAAAPWQGDDVTAVTVPTTVPPPSTTSPATAPDAGIDVPTPIAGEPGWTATPPDGWTETAFVNVGPGVTDERLEVWASTGAQWANGDWLALHTQSLADAMLLENATRFSVDDRTVVMRTDASGVTTTQVAIATSGLDPMQTTVTFDLASHGLSLDRLTAFIAGFDPPLGYEPVDLTSFAGADGPLAGMTQIWSDQVTGGFSRLTGAITQGWIASADGGRTGIGIGISEIGPDIDAVLPVIDEPVATVPLAAGRPASETVTVWRDGRIDDRVFATWIVGDTRVTALGYRVDLATFVDTVASATLATDRHWADLVDQQLDLPTTDVDADLDGAMADGTSWSGVVSPQQLGFSTAINGWATGLGSSDGSTIRRFTAVDVDAVLAMVPDDDPATQMVVTLADGTSVVVPLVEMGDSARRAGLWADTSLANEPVAAELLDATGDVTFGEVLGPL